MKRLLILLISLLSTMAMAQEIPERDFQGSELIMVHINPEVTTHLVFSETIQTVDFSTDRLVGEMATTNVLKLKPLPEDSLGNEQLGVLTVICESYMAQFLLFPTQPKLATKNLLIGRKEGIDLIVPNISIARPELEQIGMKVMNTKPKYHIVKAQEYKFEARLNNIYTVGNYFFVDVSLFNKTNIKYDIDQIRFKIEDKKIQKATNFQQVELQPEFALFNTKSFKKKYRNVFVFEKFTFPNQKVFSIEVSENQISGRTVNLRVDYSDILNADTL
ncbi:conjugative transposon protein TraN [Persicobacter diffluens]